MCPPVLEKKMEREADLKNEGNERQPRVAEVRVVEREKQT